MSPDSLVRGLDALLLARLKNAPDPSDAEKWDLTLELYRTALRDLTDEAFALATYRAAREEEWWSAPATLRRLAGAAGQPPAALRAEAATLFQRVLSECGEYLPNAGSYYSTSVVVAKLGPAAGAAFRAAGGSDAFTSMLEESRPFVERRFVEAYVLARQPAIALPTGDIGRREAAQLVGIVQDKSAERRERE